MADVWNDTGMTFFDISDTSGQIYIRFETDISQKNYRNMPIL